MYNRSQVSAAFSGLIGFRPSYDIGNTDALIDQDLFESSSGQYVNDMHELFTMENFANCVQNLAAFTLSNWNVSATYSQGNVVRHLGKVYQALRPSTGYPVTDIEYWKPTTMLSVWFRDKYKAAVYQLIDKLIEQKRAGEYGRKLQGNTPLYNGEGVKSNRIAKEDRFVGYMISVAERDIAAVIQRIGLQMTESASIPIYLFHSAQFEPVVTWNAETATPGRFSYQNVIGAELNTNEGYYLIGYYEEDLPAGCQAIRLINQVFYTGGCGSCNESDRGQRLAWSRFISVTPVSVSDYGAKGQMGFSLEDITEQKDLNFGLNLAISFRCDMSDLFIREKDSFIPALAAQLKVILLEAISMTVRNNQQADQVQVLAYNKLHDWDDPENPKIALRRAIKNLDFEFSGLNSICLAVNKKSGIRTTVIM